MKGIAIFYLILLSIEFLARPFHFGEPKLSDKYNAKEWLFNFLLSLPIVYILISILLN